MKKDQRSLSTTMADRMDDYGPSPLAALVVYNLWQVIREWFHSVLIHKIVIYDRQDQLSLENPRTKSRLLRLSAMNKIASPLSLLLLFATMTACARLPVSNIHPNH